MQQPPRPPARRRAGPPPAPRRRAPRCRGHYSISHRALRALLAATFALRAAGLGVGTTAARVGQASLLSRGSLAWRHTAERHAARRPGDEVVTVAELGTVAAAEPSMPALPGEEVGTVADVDALPEAPVIVQSLVEMQSSDIFFSDALSHGAPSFALAMAARLSTLRAGLALSSATPWLQSSSRITWVPLARFVVFLVDPSVRVDTMFNTRLVLECQCNQRENEKGRYIARYATESNSTFVCNPSAHSMNTTLAGAVLLQRSGRWRGGQVLLGNQRASGVTSWEIGIYPATGVDGDVDTAVDVAADIIQAANGSHEMNLRLIEDGNWTLGPNSGMRFAALFPSTRASHVGVAFPGLAATSVALGPNPGGLGADLPLSRMSNNASAANASGAGGAAAQPLSAREMVAEAKRINSSVRNSVQDLIASLKRSSMEHYKTLVLDAAPMGSTFSPLS